MSAALGLFEQGQKPEHIDGALKNFGMPMGAIELADRVGLDICHHVGTHLSESYGGHMAMPKWFERMVEDGLLGMKSGSGFYTYEGEKRTGSNEDISRYIKVEPRQEKESDASLADRDQPMADRDIVTVCLTPMLIEALKCLDEKVVEDAEHLDAAMIYGIGFPPFRGGLLHHFSTIEKETLSESITALGMEVPSNLGVLYE